MEIPDVITMNTLASVTLRFSVGNSSEGSGGSSESGFENGHHLALFFRLFFATTQRFNKNTHFRKDIVDTVE